jgi:hypothetical protein
MNALENTAMVEFVLKEFEKAKEIMRTNFPHLNLTEDNMRALFRESIYQNAEKRWPLDPIRQAKVKKALDEILTVN